MPRQTNPFQTLVSALQRALHEPAAVTESKFMRDRLTGELREVDVVVELRIGPYPFVLSFECTSGSRPVDTRWIEQMHAKHQALETDKLFLVSQHGFTTPALVKAQAYNHVPLSLSGIEDEDWTVLLTEHRRVLLRELRASVVPFVGEVFRGRQVTLDSRLRRIGCNLDVSMSSVVDTLLAHAATAEAALKLAAASEGGGAVVQFDVEDGLEVIDFDGQAQTADRLSFALTFRQTQTDISLTSGILGEHATSFGGARTEAGRVHIAVVQTRGDRPRVSVHEYGKQQESRTRELIDGVASDLEPLPDSTMRLIRIGR